MSRVDVVQPVARQTSAAIRTARRSSADLDGLVFHELRHTAVALAIAQGAHPLAIKERLGHSSITVTMDCYGGLFPRLEEAIGEGLDGVLRDSLAAWVRPETASTVHLRTSAV
jgi:integrase